MFRTLKTEFESRPVYLRRNDRIVAHFITCFLALLIFKTLKLRLGQPDLTTSALRKNLISMDYLKIWGEGYMPVFKGDDTTTAIASFEDRFGNSLKRMTAVTDRHSAYFALHFMNHQVCLAHLLRECQYLNELDKGQVWSKSVESLLQEAIHGRNQRPTPNQSTLSHGSNIWTNLLMKTYQDLTKSSQHSRTGC